MELDLRALLNSLAVGVYVCDSRGEPVFVNDAALHMFGLTSFDELLPPSRHPFDHLEMRSEDGAVIPPERMPLERALTGEEVVFVTEVYDHVTRGTVVLRTRTTPLRDSTNAIIGAVKVSVDVTKEHELAKVKDDFIRQAAHELKTPIAVIKANAEAALTAGAAPSRQQLQGVVRGVDRMDALINSLLDLLDLQGGLFSFTRFSVPLERVVTGAIQRLSEKTAGRVRVVASAPMRVQCDEARLRRAVYSIIDNALKYSPSNEIVEIALTEEAGAARVAIRDHGFGIPADKRPRIFEKFFRAHAGTPADAGGIGVGLFVAREIVHQHGGRLWFESPDDGGTVFYLELPIDEEAR